MASKTRHSGGELSKAGKNLQNPKSSKSTKSKAGKTLEEHQKKCH